MTVTSHLSDENEDQMHRLTGVPLDIIYLYLFEFFNKSHKYKWLDVGGIEVEFVSKIQMEEETPPFFLKISKIFWTQDHQWGTFVKKVIFSLTASNAKFLMIDKVGPQSP